MPARSRAPLAPRRHVVAARRGMSLIELLVVLLVIGVLAAIAVPRLEDSTALARGSALAGRVRAVQTVYAAEAEPAAELLAEAAGTVPPRLRGGLRADHFGARDGVRMEVVGAGEDVWLRLEATSARGEQVLAAFHRVGGIADLHTGGIAMVPLSGRAVALVDAMRGTAAARSGDVSAIAEASARRRAALLDDATPGGTATAGDDEALVTAASFETDDSNGEANPVCSPELPKPAYQQCLATTSSGYFRK